MSTTTLKGMAHRGPGGTRMRAGAAWDRFWWGDGKGTTHRHFPGSNSNWPTVTRCARGGHSNPNPDQYLDPLGPTRPIHRLACLLPSVTLRVAVSWPLVAARSFACLPRALPCVQGTACPTSNPPYTLQWPPSTKSLYSSSDEQPDRPKRERVMRRTAGCTELTHPPLMASLYKRIPEF